jgi:hypothetical protein
MTLAQGRKIDQRWDRIVRPFSDPDEKREVSNYLSGIQTSVSGDAD